MRHYDNGHCGATLVRRDDELEILTLRTKLESRGKGHARALMEQILRDADEEGTVLLISVGWGKPGGLSRAQISDFYARLGFDAVGHSEQGLEVMQRVPHAPRWTSR